MGERLILFQLMYLAGESWSLELYSSHQGPSPVAVSFKHEEQLDTDIEYIYLNLPFESRFDIYFTSLIITNIISL